MLEARQNVIDAMLMIASMLGNDYVKTVAHYTRVIQRAARAFYSGRIDSGEFIGRMIEVIEVQMRKAWYEGMRANDLDPERDMKPEWENILQGVINGEFEYVLDYAADIEKAAAEGLPVSPLEARADLWANRYNEVVNLSKLTTRPHDRYKWVMGATEQHCETCAGLHGKIASAADWLGSGYRPQGRNLACGGWRCQCRLEYTEEPPTQIGPPRI
jgi:hypothetical protein